MTTGDSVRVAMMVFSPCVSVTVRSVNWACPDEETSAQSSGRADGRRLLCRRKICANTTSLPSNKHHLQGLFLTGISGFTFPFAHTPVISSFFE